MPTNSPINLRVEIVFDARASSNVEVYGCSVKFVQRTVAFGGFASKVVVAPKVDFLPQKSFRSAVPFADYDLPAAVSEFVLRWPLGFTLVSLLDVLSEQEEILRQLGVKV